MKTLVIYYSLDGNTGFIAGKIAEATGADMLELKMKQDIGGGFMRYLRGGKQVVRKEKPELLPLQVNPGDYDVIFMGSPVWAGSYAPAFNTFFNTVTLKGKKVALFACYGGQAAKTFINFRGALEGNDILGEIGFRDPLKKDTEKSGSEAAKWAAEILDSLK